MQDTILRGCGARRMRPSFPRGQMGLREAGPRQSATVATPALRFRLSLTGALPQLRQKLLDVAMDRWRVIHHQSGHGASPRSGRLTIATGASPWSMQPPPTQTARAAGDCGFNRPAARAQQKRHRSITTGSRPWLLPNARCAGYTERAELVNPGNAPDRIGCRAAQERAATPPRTIPAGDARPAVQCKRGPHPGVIDSR